MDVSLIDTNVLVAQLGMIEVLGCAIITGIFGCVMKWQDKRRTREREEDIEYRRKREADEQARQDRDAAVYGVVLSTARGTEVLLHKAHGDNLNGDVEHSLNSIEESISVYNNLANKNMSKLG